MNKEEHNTFREKRDNSNEEVLNLWLNSYFINLKFNKKDNKICVQ
jgi:hypothetical protein